MTPTIKKTQKNTYHKDGSVSYWSVYTQQWVREMASQIADKDLATLSTSERGQIAAMAAK